MVQLGCHRLTLPCLVLQAVVRGHQARQAQLSTLVLQPILARAMLCRDELVASRSALWVFRSGQPSAQDAVFCMLQRGGTSVGLWQPAWCLTW